MSKARQLRQLFKQPGFFRLIGAHNGLTAKLIERAGFEGIWASSLEVSASHAVPDANILTMTDYLDAAISMNDAVSLPVVVDVDQGYGNSNNVIRMIKKFEAAGIAGVMIEDKKFPKQNSLLTDGRQDLASIPEFVGKIMGAKNAQRSNDFMVMARIEALIAGWGHDEAIKRAKAYVKAGADAIMIHSKSSDPAEVVNFINAWDDPTPVVIVPTNYYTLTEEKIKELPKVKTVIYANHVIRSAVTSIKQTLNEIKQEAGIHTISPKLIPVKELFELQGTFEMKAHEKQFLRTEDAPISVVIPATGKVNDPSLKDLLQVGDKELLDADKLMKLDIHGKSLLERNAAILQSFKIKKINIVTGNAEKGLTVPASLIENKEFTQNGQLHSIMLGMSEGEGKTLLLYADVIFEKQMIAQLLHTTHQITLVVDRSYKNSNLRDLKKERRGLLLVKAENEPIVGAKIVRNENPNHVLQISKKLNLLDADYEFTGISLFSEQGKADIQKAYQEAKEEFKGKPFYDAALFEQAAFSDLLQYMIGKGYKINLMEVDTGWAEVYSYEDYKRVCKMLAR
jgi:phosphoenolpyruvate phosphomutase